MSDTYLSWLRQETTNRVWINNPTREEVGLAIAQGAVSCTTNPAYGGNLLSRAPGEIVPDIEAVAATGASGDEAVAQVQERLVARILPSFAPLHQRSGGREGWVSMQGAPELDVDPAAIISAARRARALAPNCIPKIPATGPGLEAMDILVREGHPVLMTEVFSLAQVSETCRRYLRAVGPGAQAPAFIMAPITGIFGDHLRKVAQAEGRTIGPEAITWAGVIWARAAKRLVDTSACPVQLLYGGARSTADLTELVGGGHASTVNWSTFEEILAADPPRRETIDEAPPAEIDAALRATFDDFARAMEPDGLAVEEFEGFGPVQHFRDAFIAGWTAVRDAVADAQERPSPA